MSRGELWRAGDAVRQRLGFEAATPVPELAPGLDDLTTEMVFGAVWTRPGLAIEDRMLATLSALTSRQFLPQFGRYVGGALNIGVAPRAIQEVAIHCGIYAGFPSILNSLSAAAEVFAERGVEVSGADIPEPDAEALMAAGVEVMEALHGAGARAGYASPDNTATKGLYDIAVAHAYGGIWNRPGLDRRQRLICTVASFTALNLPGQVVKFSRAAHAHGLSTEEIFEAIGHTGPYTGFPRALNALALVGEALETPAG
ncbi:MAG: carboxymuconolactone decarboxylase family protein [Magnetovibrio sp.]|nr:carboxymuconolactone decarboxylase family protein [Magnetovibrio sp.]